MIPRLLSALLAALMVLVAAPAASADQVPVDHVSSIATDLGPEADTIIAPGEVVDLTVRLRGSGSGVTLHDLEGKLTSQTPGASVTLDFSTYTDLGFGAEATNANPYRISLASMPCGTPLELSLRVTADGYDPVDIPITVPTGARAPGVTYAGTQVPRPIPLQGLVTSGVDVLDTGLVKRVMVTIGDLDHTYVSDLKISLESPSGRRAILLDQLGGDLDGITDATFVASGGVDPEDVSPPYSGLKLNAPQLANFDGEQIDGRWKLIVDDTRNSDDGMLNAWSVNLAPATCEPVPIASFTATPNPVDPGQAVTLDATESVDPTDAIGDYEWDLDGDGDFDDATGITTTTSWADPQRVTVGLRISAGGQFDVMTQEIAVTGAPDAALVASSTNPLSGVDVGLDATGTIVNHDPGFVAQYDWDLDGDQIFETSTFLPTLTTTWATPGLRTVRVRVTDDFGATDIASVDVDVQNRAPAGTLEVLSAPVVAGVATTLSVPDGADADGTIDAYTWDADGDGAIDAVTGPEPTFEFVYATPGTYTARVEIRDDSGGITTVTKTVVVETPNLPPTAVLTASPQTADPGETITLSAVGSSDPDGTVGEYRWDTDGDGSYELSTGTTPTTSVTYSNPGTFGVRVRVIDDRGGFATKLLALTIRGADPRADGGGAGGVPDPQGGATNGAGPGGPGGPGPGGGATAAPGASAGAGEPRATTPPAFGGSLGGVAIQKLRRISKRGLAISCVATDRGRCIVVATLRGADAKRLGLSKKAKPMQIGRVTAAVAANKRVTLRLKLSAAVRKALKRRPSTRVVLYGLARDWFGHEVELSRVVLVRR
jgi:subtilisin-like proprotein convertase family protein